MGKHLIDRSAPGRGVRSAAVEASFKRLAQILAGATVIAALVKCSEGGSTSTSTLTDPLPAAVAPLPAAAPPSSMVLLSESDEARARVERLRAMFPGALGPAEAARFEAGPDGTVRTVARDRGSITRRATVELPRSATGAVRLMDETSRMAVTFALEGATDSAITVADGLAHYPGAAPGGADVVHRVHPGGTEDFVFFEREPAQKELRYRVDVSGVAGLRLVSRALEFLDRGGAPRLRVAPPRLMDATGAWIAATLAVEGCAVDADPRAPWGRPVVSPGAGSCTVKVAWGGARVHYPALVDPEWVLTDTMAVARTRHTATSLDPADLSSLVLIAGGYVGNGGAAIDSAEIYHPLDRTFAMTASMIVARGSHTATRLNASGAVLIAGGANLDNLTTGVPLGSLEVWNPSSGQFVADLPDMAPPRFNHTATLIEDGSVLIAGGTALPLNQPTNTGFVYGFTDFSNLAVNTLVPTPPMQASRSAHAAARVEKPNVQPTEHYVLLSGGFVLGGTALQSAEIYDASTAGFTNLDDSNVNAAGIMAVPRTFHTATTLTSGGVLVAGGANNAVGGIVANTAERYVDDGVARGFLPFVTMNAARAQHTAAVISPPMLLPPPNPVLGDVVVAGGFNGTISLASVEVYSLASNSFKLLTGADMATSHRGAASVLVNAGNTGGGNGVLVTGGNGPANLAQAASEILLKLLADTCASDGECLSGHCTLGICCDTACNEECRSCTAAGKGSGNDGECGFSAAGTALGWKCVITGEGVTESLKACDAFGVGQVVQSNPCLPNTCADDGERCAKDCPCADAGWCSTAADDPIPEPDGGAPDAGPFCKDRRPPGQPCSDGLQCHTGNCVDGVCCNLTCQGQCEACNLTDKVGFCTNVGTPGSREPPRPNTGGSFTRPPCAGTGSGCEGQCNGSDPLNCDYPGADTMLAEPICSCPDEGCAVGPAVTTTGFCDGSGSSTEASTPCNGFRCASATACKTTCASDEDCILDYICNPETDVCDALTSPSCDGDHIVRLPAAEDQDCTPYKCSGAACRTECGSVDDCVNAVCNGASQCVQQLEPAVVSSCAVNSGPGKGGALWPTALGALAAAAIRRRRRAAARSRRME